MLEVEIGGHFIADDEPDEALRAARDDVLDARHIHRVD
jgi:hypothetical protein